MSMGERSCSLSVSEWRRRVVLARGSDCVAAGLFRKRSIERCPV
jgi:hypothetical protein